MAELKGDIIINKNIEKCFELFDFSEENSKKIDPTILFHTIQNKTENMIGSTYQQGRDDNGNILETTVEITEYVSDDDYKKVTAQLNVNDFFEIMYYYQLEKVDAKSTKFTYCTRTTPKKMLTRIIYKLFRLEKKYNVDNFLNHIKDIIESS